jgi:integrase/recombinase XerD
MPLPEPLRVSDGTLLSLEPLEQLSPPPDLDGGHGTNRALGNRPQMPRKPTSTPSRRG